jgi:hypothetical protein
LLLAQAPSRAAGRADLPGKRSPSGLPDPVVEELLAQVDPGTITTLTGNLSGEWPVDINGELYTIETRYSLSGEPIDKAASYLYEYYQALGLEVSFQEFEFAGHALKNVVAEKSGSLLPQRIYLLTSHYDDVPSSPPAPGADDNASGTVGVMVAANLLSQVDSGCTLRFVNFAAEEQGLFGSKDYAEKAYCAGEDIRGVINLDMIGWNTAASSPEMGLHTNGSIPGSPEIGALFQEVIAAYGLNLEAILASPVTSASDHASFWNHGYPAILAIEDLGDFNPNYHTKEDKLENLPDLDYYTEMIKGSLATFAHLGCLIEGSTGDLTGTITDQEASFPIPGALVTLVNQDPGWGYTRSAETDEYGMYNLAVLSGWHTISVDAYGYARTEIGDIFIENGSITDLDAELVPVAEKLQYFPVAEFGQHSPPTDCP